MKLRLKSSVGYRKALVSRLSEPTVATPHYDGVPGCTYTIGAYKVLKDGSIETEDGIGDVLDDARRRRTGRYRLQRQQVTVDHTDRVEGRVEAVRRTAQRGE